MKMNDNSKFYKSINEFGELLNALKPTSVAEEKAKENMIDGFNKLSFSVIVNECELLKQVGKLSGSFEKIEKGARLLRKNMTNTYGAQMASLDKWGQDKLKLEIRQKCLSEVQKKDNSSNENA